jgi:low affinity Fe/Cu permease
MNTIFRKFSQKTSELVGTSWAFIIAGSTIVLWAITGPMFGFSDTWQLVINTGTTIVTFLMVFLIQNTQNRDAKALHLKLDELLRASTGARTHLVDLENCSDQELADLQKQFERLGQREKDKLDAASPGRLGDLEEDLEDFKDDVREVRESKEGAQRGDAALTR